MATLASFAISATALKSANVPAMNTDKANAFAYFNAKGFSKESPAVNRFHLCHQDNADDAKTKSSLPSHVSDGREDDTIWG